MIKILEDVFQLYGKHYHSFGDYSATSLIDSPRRVQLYKRYGHLEVHTPRTELASLIGTSVHEKIGKYLRMAAASSPKNYVIEGHVVHPIVTDYGIRLLSGQFDIMEDSTKLHDIKTCKTWKIIFDPDKKEWTEQLNIYRWILKHKGIDIKHLCVDAIYLDWIENKAIADKRYPQDSTVEYAIDVWDDEKIDAFIHHKMNLHASQEAVSDEELLLCKPDEMWEEPTTYAIFKNTEAKKATKVVKDGGFTDAISVAMATKGIGEDGYVEIRYGIRKRCEQWCGVNGFCNQYKSYCAGKNQLGQVREQYPLRNVA